MKKSKAITIFLVSLVILVGILYFLLPQFNINFSPPIKKSNNIQGQANPQISSCGNGVIDEGENCYTCRRDVQCQNGYECTQNYGEYYCTPICGQPIVVNNGDSYFTENSQNPKWRWILRNLDSQTPTQINSPDDIEGMVLGIGNAQYTELEEPLPQTDWNDKPRLYAPHGFAALMFYNIYPYEELNEEDNRGTLHTTVKYDITNTVQAQNVPTEYQQYLSQSAHTVTINVNSPALEPFDNVPAIFLDDNIGYYEHIGIHDWIWFDDNDADWINYYIELKNVREDFSIDTKIRKVECLEDYSSCNYTTESEQNIPLNSYITVHGNKFYNRKSGYYAPMGEEPDTRENYKEWAVIYKSEGNDTPIPQIPPTNSVILQTALINNTNQTMVFYKQPETNALVFLKSERLYNCLEEDIYNEYNCRKMLGHIDYYNGYSSLDVAKISDTPQTTTDEFAVWINNWADVSLVSFALNNQNMIQSFGEINNEAENFELRYYSYVLNDYDWDRAIYTPIGNINVNLKTAYGTRIENPAQNSVTNNGAVLNIYNQRSGASISFEKYGNSKDNWEDDGYLSLSKQLYSDLFGHIGDWNSPWLVDYSTILYNNPEYYSNPLKLDRDTQTFNNQELVTHEAFVFGTDNYNYSLRTPPAITTSLTWNTPVEERFTDNVYTIIGQAVEDSQLRNEGIKYFYVFENNSDLTTLSEQNKILMNFLGRNHEIVGYIDEDSLLIKPYCEPICGNGVAEETEQCDRSDLRGETCASLGLGTGTLGCYGSNWYNECTFDTSECSCGNGVLDDGEACDGDYFTDYNACQDAGYTGGQATCTQTCTIDTSTCSLCGNNIIEIGEQCDDGNLEAGDGCNQQCEIEFCGDNICNYDFYSNQTESCGNCQQDCGTCCFAGDTKVLTPEGEKEIKELEIGDRVISFNENTNSFGESEIITIFEHETNSYLLINKKLKVTPEHPMMINNEWKNIGDAKLGDRLKTQNGFEKINSIEVLKEKIKVYNLEVASDHTYIANGFIVHNKPPIEPEEPDPVGGEH